MATYTYDGYYRGVVSGTTFTITAPYSDSNWEADDGQSGDTTFSVGETVSGETFVGYTAAGETITQSSPSIWYLNVPPGGNSTRTTSSTVSFTAGDFTTCFLRGTLILTARGEVPVEKLRAGDLVVTKFGGLRPIRWIGTQRFHPRFASPTNTPIRFAPGSLGQGIPSTALSVSPGHAMLVGEVLAHAGALVNGTTITQPAFQGDSIDYFHLDLGPHDCVLANGAWAESYFEDQNRNSFHNAADFHARFPGHEPVRQATCLPILTEAHPDLPAIRDRLALAPATPHLLADGRIVALEPLAPGTWQATIPEGTTRLRLRSPTFQPEGEARALGLMVHALALDEAPIAPEGDGWHAPEDGWRWTTGDATLPARAGRLTVQGWWPAMHRAA